jgi:hypothetical protein
LDDMITRTSGQCSDMSALSGRHPIRTDTDTPYKGVQMSGVRHSVLLLRWRSTANVPSDKRGNKANQDQSHGRPSCYYLSVSGANLCGGSLDLRFRNLAPHFNLSGMALFRSRMQGSDIRDLSQRLVVQLLTYVSTADHFTACLFGASGKVSENRMK